MENYNTAIPYRAFHVGEFLKEQLEYAEMSQSELARLSGIKKPIINDIIKGRRDMTAEQSVIFGASLGVDADYFWKLQQRYEMDLARISSRVTEQTAAIGIWNILKTIISTSFLKKAGVIELKDVRKDIANVFKMFNVKGLEDLVKLKSAPENAAYRKSEKLQTDDNSLFTWKYYCMDQSKAIKLDREFDKNCMDEVISELNVVFFENTEVLSRTREILNRYGIKFIIAPKYGQIPVDGLSFWFDDNPTIALTLRYDRIDTFAFSVFHELGHIKLHLSVQNGEPINPENVTNKRYEDEADDFAQSNLIPMEIWRTFKNEYRKSVLPLDRFILKFASSHGINPRILYGRFCHEADNYRHKVSIPFKIL